MRIAPSEGDSAEVTSFRDSTGNRLQARAHDDETCSDNTDIHLYYGDC